MDKMHLSMNQSGNAILEYKYRLGTYSVESTASLSRSRSHTGIFYTKLRIWASTYSLLELSEFEYSEFRTSFINVP